jgi:cytochrome P450
VANTARTAAKDLDMGGTLVPAGATMQVPFIYLAEQDPRWAGEAPGSPLDPAAFVPERMLTKEGAKPGSLMPFGHGPRFCLGFYLAMVEMKVFLALLARGYDFTADTNTDWGYAVGKVPKNRLPLTLTPLAQPLV